MNYSAAAEKHYAFRGLELSLRRTGRASAGVATGRRELNLPQKKEVHFFPVGSSHCAFPQDKEGYGSIASHEENWS
ncbi:hypothetical protein J2Z83_002641 [Virgibacillus natechei]|uniref:Uncharacterized protein n=1 Tax=Virgibacillus natechei TaxID=1216297 RepID=A0ABS4IIW7_9BACI|nr:hypothetical protein [Virgibacillus natechei]